MPTVESLEPDPDRAMAIAHDGLILLGLVGSTVHGLALGGHDDRDELGVTIEPPEHLLGTRRFDHLVWRTQPEGAPSGAGDVDLTVYGLRRYCMLARKGSLTVLLPLFAQGDDLVHITPDGERLREIAPWFATRQAGRALLGYLEAQRRKIADPAHVRDRERVADGYDGKYAMHALRIAHQGAEFLGTGAITLPVAEPRRSEIMAVRRGEVDSDGALAAVDAAARRLEEALAATRLPDHVDDGRLDAWLATTYRDAWDRADASRDARR
ncbi:DNA polymerase beta superfamily protein [Patulibacter sp.]|uniref:DNA polymerase beta superfamily protein n=1 Tax=Patulibacter sp. TaxID=1912859 RepID=UPI00271F1FA5|nr:nucleotidyltransferase domain-containing protein [Patulibacter sp.]MDO9407537.1 nucleotidyltransferase domain-containing protein [Patulibacter sp.]